MMEERIVLRTVARFLIPFLILYALYIQLHGEYSPGGGFQAGVIAAAAFVLYALIYGIEKTHYVLPFRLVKALACIGPAIYAGTGIVAMFKGGEFLNYSVLSADKVHGQQLGIIVIELGVGLTVFAVMILFFYIFAERKNRR